MNKLLRLQATYKLLTPAWLGNAGQEGELRPSSLKGLLRFWFRAIEPRYRSTGPTSEDSPGGGLSFEARLFGTTREPGGIGLGTLSLKLPASAPRLIRWEDVKAGRFDEGFGKNTRNGLLYLGFSLKMNSQRTALPAGLSFTVHWDLHPSKLLLRDGAGTRRLLRGLLASFWLLGTLGGMGTRSRRGFGALALEDWQVSDITSELIPDGSPLTRLGGKGGLDPLNERLTELLDSWRADLNRLPLLYNAASASGWRAGLNNALGVFDEWFPTPPEEARREMALVPSLGPAFQALLLEKPYPAWEPCLNQLGRAMQDFRLRRQPDYDQVKAHARFMMGDRAGVRLRQAPQRVVFGLPLTFRFSSLPGAKSVQLYSFDPMGLKAHDRHPSPLLLRPVQLKTGLHGLVVRLDGPRPGVKPEATLGNDNVRLAAPSTDLLQEFMKSLGGNR